MSKSNSSLKEIKEYLYLLKQHTPVSDASFDLLDYVTFGFFDGMKLLQDEISRKQYYDFDYDAFILSSVGDLEEKHAARPDMQNMSYPYCMVTMLQLLPFCEKRCSEKTTREELLRNVSGSFESAITDCSNNDARFSGGRITFYPYFSFGQVDIVIIIQGNSLVFMYSVIEKFMHNTRFQKKCYTNESATSSCCDKVCFTSSYSVCGVLSASQSLKQSTGAVSEGEFYTKVADSIDIIDCYPDLKFFYRTYVRNSTEAKTYLCDYLKTVHGIDAPTWGLVGNHDYGYLIEPRNKDDLKAVLLLTASVCCGNPNIAGTSLQLQIKTAKDSANEYLMSGDPLENGNGIPHDNRKFEHLFCAMNNPTAAPSEMDLEDAMDYLLTKYEIPDNDKTWHTKEWRTLASDLDEMYEFCNQLAKSHFSSGIGTMLIQPFQSLYSIYMSALPYLLELDTGEDDASLIDPLIKNELSDFMNSMDKTLSNLLLSTNSLLETRDFHSNELNSHSKYLVAYYVFIKMALKEVLKINRAGDDNLCDIEVLVSVTNSLNMSCKQILGKYCDIDQSNNPTFLYILSVPMLYLKNPYAMFPMLLHEIGHMKGNAPENSLRKKYMDRILHEAFTAAIFPEGVIAKYDGTNKDVLKSFKLQASNNNKPVTLNASMLSNDFAKINSIAKDVAKKAYDAIFDQAKKLLDDRIKFAFQILDDNDYDCNLRLDYYDELLSDNLFFIDLLESDNDFYKFASGTIKACNIELLTTLKSTVPGAQYILDEIIYRAEHMSYSFSSNYYLDQQPEDMMNFAGLRTIPTNRVSCVRVNEEHPSRLYFTSFCQEVLKAANEIYADIIMLKCLGISNKKKNATVYLDCFSDQGLSDSNENLANAIRILSILKSYFLLDDNEISTFIHKRVKDIPGYTGYNEQLLQEAIKCSVCFSKKDEDDEEITAEQLFVPILDEYIKELDNTIPAFSYKTRPFNHIKGNRDWARMIKQSRSKRDDDVIYSLWRDLKEVRV